jgi:hypothetical protein
MSGSINLKPVRFPKHSQFSREEYHKLQIYEELLCDFAVDFSLEFHDSNITGLEYDTLRASGIYFNISLPDKRWGNISSYDLTISIGVQEGMIIWRPDTLYAILWGGTYQGYYRELVHAGWPVGTPDLQAELGQWVVQELANADRQEYHNRAS